MSSTRLNQPDSAPPRFEDNGSRSTVEHLLWGQNPVTLITTFHLRDDAAPDGFVRRWNDVACLMRKQHGFVSARLNRATGGLEEGAYVQIAHWAHARCLAAAQADPEIRALEKEVHKLVMIQRRVLCESARDAEVLHH